MLQFRTSTVYCSIITSFVCYIITLSSGVYWQTIVLYDMMVIPNNADIPEKSSITIYCGSSSAVSWTHTPFNYGGYDLQIYQRHRQESKRITLINVRRADSGAYSCKGDLKNGRQFTYSVFIEVFEVTPARSVVPNWVEASKYGSVTLTCGSKKGV